MRHLVLALAGALASPKALRALNDLPSSAHPSAFVVAALVNTPRPERSSLLGPLQALLGPPGRSFAPTKADPDTFPVGADPLNPLAEAVNDLDHLTPGLQGSLKTLAKDRAHTLKLELQAQQTQRWETLHRIHLTREEQEALTLIWQGNLQDIRSNPLAALAITPFVNHQQRAYLRYE